MILTNVLVNTEDIIHTRFVREKLKNNPAIKVVRVRFYFLI